ncbi:TetR/AcrR family transcriptional regulator C-terminal domain-containing protein [Nocardia tengchongensis]
MDQLVDGGVADRRSFHRDGSDAEELIRRVFDGWQPSGQWRTDLHELGARLRAVYVAHPHAAPLIAARVSGRPHETHAAETVLGLLRSTGLPDAIAVQTYRAFVFQALGMAALDAAARALPEASRRTDLQAWNGAYPQLPSATHPNIAALAPLLTEVTATHSYLVALELVLGGVSAQIDRHRPRSRALLTQ